MKKKILFVDHTPFVGGAQLALVRHLRHLDRAKFEALVASSGDCPEVEEMLKESGARVALIPFGKLKTLDPLVFVRFFRTVAALLDLIGREDIDLIVSNTERAAYPSTIAAVLSRRKVVWIMRDFEYFKPLVRLLRNYTAAIVFVSQAVKEFYFSREENPLFKVVYVGSDFKTALAAVKSEAVGERRKRWGVKEGGLVIGFVGRLVWWKGAQVLIRAGKLMKEGGFELGRWKIVVVGSGEGQSGSNEEELHRLVKAFNLEKETIFMGYRRDIPLCLSAFNIFVHPSVGPEPFATVVVEAMAAALPVAASNLGGTPEIVEDEKTGLLFPADDDQALADILMRLMRDFSLRKRLGAEARKVVLKGFSESRVTRNLESVYTKVFANEID